jgi:hypothetical protein
LHARQRLTQNEKGLAPLQLTIEVNPPILTVCYSINTSLQHQKPPGSLQFPLSSVLQPSIIKMFTLMLRAYAITAVIFLTFSAQPSAAEDCNEQNGCVQHCGKSMQPHYDDPKTKTCEFILTLLLPESFHQLICNYSKFARTTRGRFLNALPTNAPRGILLPTRITDLVRHKFQSQCSKKNSITLIMCLWFGF